MLDEERKNSNVQIWAGISLITALLGLAGGMWLASTVLYSSEDSDLAHGLRASQARVSQLETEVWELRTDLKDSDSASQALAEELAGATHREKNLGLQLSQAEAQAYSALQTLTQKESELLTPAEEQIATLEAKIQSLQSQETEGTDNPEAISEMSNIVERHRLLLVELRKEPPETREGTATYWYNIRTIASKAAPALTSPADKVILKIDNYFDWSERSPNITIPADEYSDAYFDWLDQFTLTGAEAFVKATESFRRDALLEVITHLDSIVSRLN
ncbi:hypothetical protein FIM08_01580 [SAR202 cluster bacterium AC-647-N09_OGT_505m]|nr:hypothetical protein [SAR202 cluster bacterium AC-647-N09_OGT_505m]